MSLVETLLAAGNRTPNRTALRFLDSKGETKVLTFAELDNQARRLSEFLCRRVASGGAVLLAFPPGLAFLPAFLGCLYADVLAVPVAAPLRADDRRLQSIAANCGAALGLTTRALGDKLCGPPDGAFAWISVEDIFDGATASARQRRARSSSTDRQVAYLQYTSGSTHSPRGVEVTRRNLLHNLNGVVDALALGPNDVCITWLPHFHDMGLVGTLLAPLFVGASSVVMPPFDFVRSPLKWLKAFSTFGGTFTASPNFGYALCVERVSAADRAGLDLSTWRAAPNGAEPVRAEIVRRFVEAFAPSGFKPSAMAPCYGLAEATLVVSMSRPSKPVAIVGFDRAMLAQGIAQPSSAHDAVSLVGCGPPVLGTEIAIVDAGERRQAPDRVGEIWVRSDSVANGYHNLAPNELDGFRARMANEPGAFLKTGDLGFLHDGELFVTGRLKDLIIVRGRNLHPHDIELTAREAHPHLQDRAVAFAVESHDGESVVILQEVKAALIAEEIDNVVLKMRAAINQVHGVDPLEIVLLPRRTIALTSSGKLARWRSRQAWEKGELPSIARWTRAPSA